MYCTHKHIQTHTNTYKHIQVYTNIYKHIQIHTNSQADLRYEQPHDSSYDAHNGDDDDAASTHRHLFATASVEDFGLTVNMYMNTMTVNASLGNARVTGMLLL